MWMVRYQAHRANLLVYAEDLTHFAQTIKIHLGQGKHSERRFCEHGRFSVAQKDTYLLWVWRGRTHQGKLSKQEDCQHVRMPSGKVGGMIDFATSNEDSHRASWDHIIEIEEVMKVKANTGSGNCIHRNLVNWSF